MNETIQKIRELLTELESAHPSGESSFKESCQLFELPEIVSAIVDYLHPVLNPMEVALYWFIFRHSVVATGDVFARVSVGDITNGAIRSHQDRAEGPGRKCVSSTLRSLAEKSVISVVGDTNKRGTLYRIYLPEEIEICREAMSKARQEELPQIDPKHELDFYNIKENRLKVFERDKYLCHYCRKQLTRFNATLDHLQPVSQGGDNSYDNLVTSCLQCNSQRGAQPLMDYLTRKQDGPKQ
jgi:hypothetical protein